MNTQMSVQQIVTALTSQLNSVSQQQRDAALLYALQRASYPVLKRFYPIANANYMALSSNQQRIIHAMGARLRSESQRQHQNQMSRQFNRNNGAYVKVEHSVGCPPPPPSVGCGSCGPKCGCAPCRAQYRPSSVGCAVARHDAINREFFGSDYAPLSSVVSGPFGSDPFGLLDDPLSTSDQSSSTPPPPPPPSESDAANLDRLYGGGSSSSGTSSGGGITPEQLMKMFQQGLDMFGKAVTVGISAADKIKCQANPYDKVCQKYYPHLFPAQPGQLTPAQIAAAAAAKAQAEAAAKAAAAAAAAAAAPKTNYLPWLGLAAAFLFVQGSQGGARR